MASVALSGTVAQDATPIIRASVAAYARMPTLDRAVNSGLHPAAVGGHAQQGRLPAGSAATVPLRAKGQCAVRGQANARVKLG